MNKIVALVPMKGHSERVPNKNIRDFAGEPLFFKILESLEKSRYIKDIYIDTDSDVIQELAIKNFDVKFIRRPKELIGDFISMNDIINYDLTQIDSPYYIQTHSTNPLLTTETIDKVIEFYFENISTYDSLFTVTRLQTRLFDKNQNAINHNPNELIRTQDLSPVFEENSNIYMFSKDSFIKNKQRIGKKPYMYELDKYEAIDIDDESDFILAEALYNLKSIK
ncbi:cytidylyltransferase domain-containing protein [Clostridium sp. BSD9I1]|uniref:acylneuraminate cytidylyltransferase family protein n=1 Tax=Clostridium sp. BSD9I1 TaxID=2003589 RepID=UPI001A9A4F8C|nr:acylneuraminate cytidylyltransferase family protein [Clostridium sp. BSD9I1]